MLDVTGVPGAGNGYDNPKVNDDPPADEPFPILGRALDGFPIDGPRACVDASFSPADYCGVHWLLARPLTATRGASDVDMSERSVLLKGTILRDGEARPLHVDTWWPHGALASLDELVPAEKLAEVRARGGAHYALVRVTRKLASMFDGIDFFVDGDDRVAGTIVDRLAEDARFEVELWSPSVGP